VPDVLVPYLKVVHWSVTITILLVFVAGWLYGCAYLLRGALRKATGQRRLGLPRCVLAMLLSGSAGIFAGGVLFMLIKTIGTAFKVDLTIPAALLAVPAIASVAYLVLAVMFPLSWKEMLHVSARPFAGMLALLIFLGAAGGIPTYYLGQRVFRQERCRLRLRRIHAALLQYERKHAGTPAPTLQALVDENILTPRSLACPSATERAIGYFYLPGPSLPRETSTNTLLACDFRDNHGRAGRAILLANGDVMRRDEEGCQEYLALPENAAFAAALRQADGP